MRQDGTVLHYDRLKGIGFLVPADGGDDLFFHYSQLPKNFRYLETGDKVSFEIGDHNQKPVAVRLQVTIPVRITPSHGGVDFVAPVVSVEPTPLQNIAADDEDDAQPAELTAEERIARRKSAYRDRVPLGGIR